MAIPEPTYDIDAIVAEDRSKLDTAFRIRAEAKAKAAHLYEQVLRGRVEAARAIRTFGDANKGLVEVTVESIPGNFIRRRISGNGRRFADVWVEQFADSLQVGWVNYETEEGQGSSSFQ